MIVVRQEREKEYLETEAALREAFWDQYAPGASEHYLAHCLRGIPDSCRSWLSSPRRRSASLAR